LKYFLVFDGGALGDYRATLFEWAGAQLGDRITDNAAASGTTTRKQRRQLRLFGSRQFLN
jgi:hypothetical protein